MTASLQLGNSQQQTPVKFEPKTTEDNLIRRFKYFGFECTFPGLFFALFCDSFSVNKFLCKNYRRLDLNLAF